jgi:hypothetical protein
MWVLLFHEDLTGLFSTKSGAVHSASVHMGLAPPPYSWLPGEM